MPIQLKRWNAANHLNDEVDVAFYLEACFAEDPGDGSLVLAALGDIARSRGMSQLSRETGLTREGLYKALSQEGNPSFATVMKVVNAFGLRLHAGRSRPESLRPRASMYSGDAVRPREAD